jgi:tetratricopeptide (TPR) repeat protein
MSDSGHRLTARMLRRSFLARLAPLLLGALLLAAGSAGRADDAGLDSLPDQQLLRIVSRQRLLFAEAAKEGANLDQESLRAQLQEICHEYELLLQDNPKFATGYAAYGELLWEVGMRKASLAMMLKANEIDPNVSFVKNKIGNFLAEGNKPLEAVNYFISAIKLEPKQPLYHYNLGLLLYEARDQFIKSDDWTGEQIDRTMQEAFQHAIALAPNNVSYLYGYAQSFYVVQHPDWTQALKAWAAVESHSKDREQVQTARLQAANILIKTGHPDRARAELAAVDAPDLQAQRNELAALLADNAKK